jgi:hypothetical protein
MGKGKMAMIFILLNIIMRFRTYHLPQLDILALNVQFKV